MAKKITNCIRLQIKAGEANPSPPIGPVLGQNGVNIREFCESFNTATRNIEKGLPIPVIITVYTDRSFSFITKTPPASILLKKLVLNGKKGSARPNMEKVGKVTHRQLEEIAKMKAPDLTAANLEAAILTIVGTARSMGIEVVKGETK